MRFLLLSLTLTLTVSVFSQSVISRKIFAFETLEKNSKIIQISKLTQGRSYSYVLIAKNETSKDYVSCKWKTEISINQLALFTKMLKELDVGDSYENNLFGLEFKKNKIKVKFKKTKCISDHKTFYFQESCNRSLHFVIYEKQIEGIVKELIPMFIKEYVAVK
tara:strand:+ start:272 stop:760 length:489 start_codon:yes stop_codon:yes gene_type:complete